MAVSVNWLQSINWIPVEERLPDVDNDEEVTYVTCEDPVTGRRYVTDFVWFYNGIWIDPDMFDDFENGRCRVVAWSTDTVDILPY
jgi:hypothetical protein